MTCKVEETDVVMEEVEQVTAEYLSLAQLPFHLLRIGAAESRKSLLSILAPPLPQHLRLCIALQIKINTRLDNCD